MPEESKESDPKVDEEVVDEMSKEKATDIPVDDESGEDEHPGSTNSDAVAASSSELTALMASLQRAQRNPAVSSRTKW